MSERPIVAIKVGIVPRGFYRTTDHVTVIDLTHPEIGVGQCRCPECGGDGDWSKFMPEPEPPMTTPCVECKGTGRIWISV